MTLRKKTIDNSVKYAAQSEPTQSIPTDVKQNMIKNNSPPRKQKKFHKLIRNLLQRYQHQVLK